MHYRIATLRSAFALGFLLAVGPAHAATFVVDSTGDEPDATLNGTCSIGPPTNACTLRAAIAEANRNPVSADIITFIIPGPGPYTIAPASALPNFTQPVTIDGTTQPGYAGTPIIELDGTSAGTQRVLTLFGNQSSGSTIRGLVINGSQGTAINILSGSSNNVVTGNYLGTDRTGTVARGNDVGVYIEGSNNRIGGTSVSDRNVISGNLVDGIQIVGVGATGNLVQGNYIGLDVTGTAALGNTNQGIAIFNTASNNTIGGTAPGARNVISGNGNAIAISVGGTTGNRVEGNFIGTNGAGTAGIGNVRGVSIGVSASGNFIGDTAPGAANRIAYNFDEGITIWPDGGTGNQISSNEIYSNGSLGIELGPGGVNPNDAGDVDVGPNELQNYPVLSAATTNGAGSANFAGSLSSAASTAYRIEFFASPAADPSGFGEGERYLGFTNVTTNAAGNALIGVSLATSLSAGELVTATATDPANNTSEFSAVITAVGSLVVTTTADTVDGSTTSVSALIAAPGADGRISLREAIQATNASAGADTIRFGIPLTDANHLYYQDDAIPSSLSMVAATTLTDGDITDFDPDYGAGQTRSWYRIQPASVLPTIIGPVVIDGPTQPGFIVLGPVIELSGAFAGAGSNGLNLGAGTSGCTIRGLVMNRFSGSGIAINGSTFDVIEKNFIGTDVSGTRDLGNGQTGVQLLGGASNNVIGGPPGSGNVISGNDLNGVEIVQISTSNNTVIGNIIGLNRAGNADLGNTFMGVALGMGASGNVIGDVGMRNVISGNNQHGLRLVDAGTSNNRVQGNYIGLDLTGTFAIGNSGDGIRLEAVGAATGNVVGGATLGLGNAISGNGGSGVQVRDSMTGTLVAGNVIGRDAAGAAAMPNGGSGIVIANSNNNTIGGTAANAPNVIASNLGDGIAITGTTASSAILGNSIFSNGDLGIDLLNNFVTANDGGDADTGPNDLLNFPMITSAFELGGALTVNFTLDVPRRMVPDRVLQESLRGGSERVWRR